MVIFRWKWFMDNIVGKQYRAFSFFIFIILADKEDKRSKSYKVLINHEKIHFHQQLELLFVFQWILYVAFYLDLLLRGYGKNNSYRLNPFEKEAYSREKDLTYLKRRKPYSWWKFMG